jgi:nucleoside-diphosphate-sugar epimerase
MKVILFGSTGMVGQGVLRECLRDPDVTEVIAVVRSASGQTDAKLREIVHQDFTDFSALKFDGEACFWCLGVSSAGMSEADYTRITHDYTLAAAKALVRPTLTFIFVSGTGAQGNAMWARVKRKTEEALHGIKSRTRLYNMLYTVFSPLIPVVKLVAQSSITDTERVGQAMLRIARQGFAKKVLENPDINVAARL